MTTQTTLLEALASLQDCFPRQELRQGTIQAYGAMLADIPSETLTAAIYRVVARSRFWPSIAEIREAAAEILVPLPTKDEFLAEVEKQRKALREGRRAEFTVQAYQDAIDAMGGWNIVMMSGNLEPFERSQLGNAYDAIRKRTQEAAVLGSMAELGSGKIAALLPPPEAGWERDDLGTPVPPDQIFTPSRNGGSVPRGFWVRYPGGRISKPGSLTLS